LFDNTPLMIMATGALVGSAATLVGAEGKKFYLRVDDVEYLLYDFDLEIGDTYSPMVCGEAPMLIDFTSYEFEVIDKTTMMIEGTERTVLTVETVPGLDPVIWIEGVGSSSGLFHGSELCSIDLVSRMLCQDRNSTNEYFFSEDWGCCIVALSNSEIEEYTNLLLYPNPIKLDQALSLANKETGTMNVYSIEGKKLISKNINTHSTLSPRDLGLTHGIFIIELVEKNRKYRERLVVQ
ncbi:MAG: T9SS type A sorting domain-containing protein, partial [Bacteroidota bacterium]